MENRKPTQHRMTRRAAAHDYTLPGTYHITLHVAEGLGQPLGAVKGDLSAPDGSPEAPHTVLTPIGQMVEHELLTAITAHYPMVTVDTYAVMPEHLHVLVKVSKPIITKNGLSTHLGQVIAGFKKGCNRAFWAATGQAAGIPAGKPAAIPAGKPAAIPAGKPAAIPAGKPLGALTATTGSVCGGSPAASPAVSLASPAHVGGAKRPPSNGTTGRAPLFADGYCDVMPVDAAQLATQRAYIADNPRSRLLRMSHHDWLTTQRRAITTVLTVTALQGFLRRECPYQATAEALAAIAGQLLTVPANGSGQTAVHSAPSGSPAGVPAGVGAPRFIICDSYGDRSLLSEHRCLPVVCHRKDAARLGEQKACCLDEAARGAVLVSARIAPGEQAIIDEAVRCGFPVALIHDNGFTDRYHPSAERLERCAEGRLLLISPWQYQYRGKDDQVTVAFCKAMNCVAQALCRKKDSWWKSTVPGGSTVPSGSPAGPKPE